MGEQALRKACIRLAERNGWLHIRLHFGPGAAAGWPDDLFVSPRGEVVFVEFKRPNRPMRVSALQWQRIIALWKHRCQVVVANNVEIFKQNLGLVEGDSPQQAQAGRLSAARRARSKAKILREAQRDSVRVGEGNA